MKFIILPIILFALFNLTGCNWFGDQDSNEDQKPQNGDSAAGDDCSAEIPDTAKVNCPLGTPTCVTIGDSHSPHCLTEDGKVIELGGNLIEVPAVTAETVTSVGCGDKDDTKPECVSVEGTEDLAVACGSLCMEKEQQGSGEGDQATETNQAPTAPPPAE